MLPANLYVLLTLRDACRMRLPLRLPMRLPLRLPLPLRQRPAFATAPLPGATATSLFLRRHHG